MNHFDNGVQKQKMMVIGGIVVAVLVVVFFAWYLGKSSVNQTGGGAAGTTAGTTAGAPAQSDTRQPVSANTTVPGATSTVSSNVAKPSVVVQAAPGATTNFRSFTIKVSGNAFDPSNIIAYVGDTVHINITAVDKDYDFYQPDYGLSMQLPKGVEKTIEFQVTAPDKYTFYCKSCGGPSKGPVGYVTVVPK
ncbi:MAG TPA: cupredoxin domain-containing protein [Candidatus Paceibacterota bacterium]|nr:cupredoxin domain-containing protein [Candidatus Paceibacterota bacterium]